ncbi:MAG: hypothetical protein MK135_15220 [Polyangiaceae bacterium]|nr:hypothetical protein [Polyangiaceae bacterium]
MTELDSEQRLRLADYFFSRASGERTTALAFEHIIKDLQYLPGTNDFLQMAHNAQQDELRHASICMSYVERYSKAPLPELQVRGERPVRFPHASEADQRILRLVFAGCFSETFAVQWLLDAHTECTDPQSRAYNRNHLRDEIKHSQLGWRFVSSGLLTQRDRHMVSAYLPLMLNWSRRLWKDESSEEDPTLSIYGCPPPQSAAAAVEKALTEVILPGFKLTGFHPIL